MRGKTKILNKFITVAMILVIGFASIGFTSKEDRKKFTVILQLKILMWEN